MDPGWFPFKIVSDSPALHSRWPLLLKIEKRGNEMFKICSPLKLLSQSQPNVAEMICGWFPSKIVSGRPFHQSLVAIGQVVSEEKIFM
jgi:hypothetical protein